ncbi:hypothetical protein LOTGIDRAFT_164988 [Lottia gigantea]|uniref:Uncharacterized protein n=1 Tax=Lottia gigantea TaxID=225164 RepID=V4A8Q8_LOTGI|nr:hypothetical protein LOTGIDRAFT_164988 [Lottia gigantea]ESO89686.1 hypothetical protein LOTGIDRAFT_164988 [Lottia gigantea]
MPPVAYMLPCTTATSTNVTTPLGDMLAKDDRNALLYIVVTLLFYSMGIIVGIITYLKRERREMLEDKTFDVYFQMKSDPYTTFKAERVQMVAARLAALERERLERTIVVPEPSGSGVQKTSQIDGNRSNQDSSENEYSSGTASDKSSLVSSMSSSESSGSDSVQSVRFNTNSPNESKNNKYDPEVKNNETIINDKIYEKPPNSQIPTISHQVDEEPVLVLSSLNTSSKANIENLNTHNKPLETGGETLSKSADECSLKLLTLDTITKPKLSRSTPEIKTQTQGSAVPRGPLSEPLPIAVAKIVESERRGGLLMSPKALHLFDRSRKRLKDRQMSMDVPDRDSSLELPNRDMIFGRQVSVDIPRHHQPNTRQFSVDIPDNSVKKSAILRSVMSDAQTSRQRQQTLDVPDQPVSKGRQLSVDGTGRRGALRERQLSVDVPDRQLKGNRQLSVDGTGRRGALRERQLSVDVPERKTIASRHLSVDIPDRQPKRGRQLSVDTSGRRGALRERQLSFDVSEREKLPNKESDVENESLLVEDEPMMDSSDDSTSCLAMHPLICFVKKKYRDQLFYSRVLSVRHVTMCDIMKRVENDNKEV